MEALTLAPSKGRYAGYLLLSRALAIGGLVAVSGGEAFWGGASVLFFGLCALLFAREMLLRTTGLARGCHRTSAPDAVGRVIGSSFVDGLAHIAIALIIVNGNDRAGDRDLVEVRSSQPDQLGIDV